MSPRRRDTQDDDEITQFLERVRTPDWEDTRPFAGASEPGQPEPATAPLDMLRARGTRPATFPVLHDDDPHARRRAWHRDRGQHAIADSLTPGWAHLFEIRCAYPAADHATPIPCDAAWRDPAARSFPGLRESARAAGWDTDALGRHICPRCGQASPRYLTTRPVILWDPGAAEARARGDLTAERRLRAAAELELAQDVNGSARRGKHAEVIR